MKRLGLLFVSVLILAHGFLHAGDAEESLSLKGKKSGSFPFYVYTDKGSKLNHFVASGWMGDFGDLKINDSWNKDPLSGKTCIQIKYTGVRTQNAGWTGIYWQNPANNWGTSKGGFDLSGSKKLYFYARGEKGGEIVEFKIGGITGDYSDSTVNSTGKLELKKTWTLYTLDLEDADLSYVSGGFCFVLSSEDNPDGCAFYLDDVYYHNTAEAVKVSSKASKKK